MRLSLLARGLVSAVLVGLVSITIVFVAALAVGVVVSIPLSIVGAVVALLLARVGFDSLVDPLVELFLANWPAVPFVVGLLCLPVLYLRPVQREIRAFKAELGTEGTPAQERDPKRAAVLRQLAQQADIVEPTLRIVNRRRPESFALGDESGGTIIVTRGLIRQLDDDEFEAVLAHEVSHLANGDSPLVTKLLVPMLLTEHIGSDDPPSFQNYATILMLYAGVVPYIVHLLAWALVRVVTTTQMSLCKAGLTVFSRGRELAADRAAAELTGSPSALASALQTLDDARRRPDEDKREFKQSAGALDILPAESQARFQFLFGTHPSTEKRIQHLESLVEEIETP